MYLVDFPIFNKGDNFCDILFALLHTMLGGYRNNPKNWDILAFANSVDPDKMPQNMASDQGLHCLTYIQQYFRHSNG